MLGDGGGGKGIDKKVNVQVDPWKPASSEFGLIHAHGPTFFFHSTSCSSSSSHLTAQSKTPKRNAQRLLLARTMPPLPTSGTSYPPSSSGYQPLHLDEPDNEQQGDVESYPYASTSTHVKQRTFASSPYRSQANDPTHLLETFLSDTRPPTAQPKDLHLRISVRCPQTTATRHVELPLPELTTHDALPFALADDVPCLRGLPGSGARTWKGRLRRLVDELTSSSSSSSNHTRLNVGEAATLQVWNASQSRPLYSSEEEVQRYHKRLETSTLPPWTPLNDEFLAPPTTATAHDTKTHASNGEVDEQVDKLFDASSSLGDFDLSSIHSCTGESSGRNGCRVVRRVAEGLSQCQSLLFSGTGRGNGLTRTTAQTV